MTRRLNRDLYEMVTFDFSFHGQNANDDSNAIPWTQWGPRDVLRQVDKLGAHHPIIGIGHSMGAACLLLAEEQRPKTFDFLILIEPPMFGPNDHENPMVRSTLRRRAEWPSYEAAKDYFKSKPIFKDWDREALERYLSGGLMLKDSKLVLRCSPSTEAKVYAEKMPHLSRIIDCSTQFVVGDKNDMFPANWYESHVKKYFTRGEINIMPSAGHFMVMTHPESVARYIQSCCNSLSAKL